MFRRSVLAVAMAIPLAVGAVAPVAAAPAVRLRITAAPSSINLGSIAVGEVSADIALYVTNGSKVPLRWIGTAFGSYGLSVDSTHPAFTAPCSNETETIVQPGQTCALFSLNFRAMAAGQVTASILSRFTDGASFVDLTVLAKAKGV